MANTTSARKAARQAVRRTEVNKSQTSRMRLSVRKVEEAVSSGDRPPPRPPSLRSNSEAASQKGVAKKWRHAKFRAWLHRQSLAEWLAIIFFRAAHARHGQKSAK